MHEVIEKILAVLDKDKFEIETYGTCAECGYDDAFATFEQADQWYIWSRCDGCGRDDNYEVDMESLEDWTDDDIREQLILDPDEEIFVV